MTFSMVYLAFLAKLLSIVQEDINDLLVSYIADTFWIGILVEHESVQNCIAILTLSVYVRSCLDQLSDRLDVFVDSGDPKRRVSIYVFEVMKFQIEVSLRH